jgi:hypothetical protein
MAKQEKPKTVENPDGTKALTLPSGKVATILPGKGIHSRKAVQMIDGDMSLYINALMCQLVEIDGKKVVMEDFDQMNIKDYNTLMAEFSDANF